MTTPSKKLIVDRAIKIIEESLETHKDWLRFLKENSDYQVGDVGDMQHHRRCIKGYKFVLKVLKGEL